MKSVKLKQLKKTVWYKFMMIKQNQKKKINNATYINYLIQNPMFEFKNMKILSQYSIPLKKSLFINIKSNKVNIHIKKLYFSQSKRFQKKNLLKCLNAAQTTNFVKAGSQTLTFFKTVTNQRNHLIKEKLRLFYLKKRKTRFINTLRLTKLTCKIKKKYSILKNDINFLPTNYYCNLLAASKISTIPAIILRKFNLKFDMIKKRRRASVRKELEVLTSFWNLFLKKKLKKFHVYQRCGRVKKKTFNKLIKRFVRKKLKIKKRLFSHKQYHKLRYRLNKLIK